MTYVRKSTRNPLLRYTAHHRRNKNFGDLIGRKKILDGKVVRKNNSKN